MMPTIDDSSTEHDERWYVVLVEKGVVAYGPDTENECQDIAHEIESEAGGELGKLVLIDSNGLVAMEWKRESEFTCTKHAEKPDSGHSSAMEQLLDAAMSSPERDDAER